MAEVEPWADQVLEQPRPVDGHFLQCQHVGVQLAQGVTDQREAALPGGVLGL